MSMATMTNITFLILLISTIVGAFLERYIIALVCGWLAVALIKALAEEEKTLNEGKDATASEDKAKVKDGK